MTDQGKKSGRLDATWILVGTVISIHPGSGKFSYYGIDVTDALFAQRHFLAFVPPQGDVTCGVSCKVSTIEVDVSSASSIKYQRTNVVKIGNQCGVRLAKPPEKEPKIGDQVYVRRFQAEVAGAMTQTLTPRPQPPAEVVNVIHQQQPKYFPK